MTIEETLPITETIAPASAGELADVVRSCFENETAVYPVGGGTSLDYGLPAKQPGVAVSLEKLNRVIDYPARDMTITVEPGATMRSLAETLAGERQQLPFDVPFPERATLGGVVAANWNGPRRFGYGSVRDYVIGVSAVDGTGRPFKGGGRVVKNVAGYDFCKLLTGSLGTLGVISELTMKVRPLAERAQLMSCSPRDLENAERLLAALGESRTAPVSVSLCLGTVWSEVLPGAADAGESGLTLLVGLEGTAPEVEWMQETLSSEWREQDAADRRVIDENDAAPICRQLADFPAGEAPLVIKAGVPPSGVTRFIADARNVDGKCSVLAHAGSGVVFVRFSEFPAEGLSRTLLARLQPAAARLGGHVVVLANPSGAEATHQSVWGSGGEAFELMTRVKERFDPMNILNPGRFVYTR